MEPSKSENEKPLERPITWEVVDDKKLKELLDDTLNEEVRQNLYALRISLEASPKHDIKSQEQDNKTLLEVTKLVYNQLGAVQRALRHDLSKPLPIDHIYESGGGRPIIALDLISTSSPIK